MTGALTRRLCIAALAGLGACLPVHHPVAPAPEPTAASEWPASYAEAMTKLRAGHADSADSALRDFEQRYPDSPEAMEVPYWRAVIKLDPANAAASHEALTLLQRYLAETPSGLHRTEATTLVRLQQAIDARAAVAAAQPPAAAVRPDDRAREEEMQRLRDELARANAELDRIKRRLARPKP